MLYNIPYHEIDTIKKKANKQEQIELIKRLFYILQVDKQQQDIEIDKAFNRQRRYNDKDDYLFSHVDVLYGSILENDVATILQSYQLKPFFTNTIGQVINFTNGYKMKNADIAVQSLKNKLLYGFDVKYGTVWRKHTNIHNFYLTNTGIFPWKLNEIRNDFKNKLIQTYNMLVDKVYLLFVCYDALSTINYYNQSILYENIFQRVPNSIQRVMFVVDIDRLFKTVTDDEFSYETFDKTSPFVIDNYLATGQNYYIDSKTGEHQYSIKMNSEIVIPFDKFIYDNFINDTIDDW